MTDHFQRGVLDWLVVRVTILHLLWIGQSTLLANAFFFTSSSGDDNSNTDDDGYSPNAYVRQMHHLPHLSERFEVQSNDFDINYESQWNSYTKSLIPLPIVIGAAGYVLLLMFQLWMLCRLCNQHCRCAPPRLGNSFFEGNRLVHPAAKYFRYLVFLGFIGLLFSPQVLIIGSEKLSDGVNTIKDGLDYVSDTFNDLNDYGNTLLSDGDTLTKQLQQAAANGCTEAATIEPYVDDYENYIKDYLSYVEPVPDKVDNIHDKVDEYGIDYKNETLYITYGCLLISAVLLFIATVVKKPSCLLTLSVFIGQLIVGILVPVCTLLMMLLMLLSDFCMNPIEYLLNCVPRSIYDVSKYYATCEGSNPFQDELDDANEFVMTSSRAINVLLNTVCQDNRYLQEALDTVGSIASTLDDVDDTATCKPIEQQIHSTVNDGFCDESFRGIYFVWFGAYVSAAGLLLYMIICSIAYLYNWPPYCFCFSYQRLERQHYDRAAMHDDRVNEEEEALGFSNSAVSPLLPATFATAPPLERLSTASDMPPIVFAECSVNRSSSGNGSGDTSHLVVAEAIGSYGSTSLSARPSTISALSEPSAPPAEGF